MIEQLKDALTYLDGAHFENYSGQLISTRPNGGQTILRELSCANCSEIFRKSADQQGEILVTLLNSAALVPDLLAACEAAAALIDRLEASWMHTTEEGQLLRAAIGKARSPSSVELTPPAGGEFPKESI